jgi:hypothetical protein
VLRAIGCNFLRIMPLNFKYLKLFHAHPVCINVNLVHLFLPPRKYPCLTGTLTHMFPFKENSSPFAVCFACHLFSVTLATRQLCRDVDRYYGSRVSCQASNHVLRLISLCVYGY